MIFHVSCSLRSSVAALGERTRGTAFEDSSGLQEDTKQVIWKLNRQTQSVKESYLGICPRCKRACALALVVCVYVT